MNVTTAADCTSQERLEPRGNALNRREVLHRIPPCEISEGCNPVIGAHRFIPGKSHKPRLRFAVFSQSPSPTRDCDGTEHHCFGTELGAACRAGATQTRWRASFSRT